MMRYFFDYAADTLSLPDAASSAAIR